MTLSHQPEISILVVTYNCREAVVRALRSVVAYPPDVSFELLLVDNASSDATAAAVRDEFPQVAVLELAENVGYGSAMNLLAGRATGRYLVFLNPDTELVEDSIGKLHAFAEAHDRLGVLSPRLVYADGAPQPSARRFPSPSRLWFEVLRLHLLLPAKRRAQLLGGTYFAQDETMEVDWTSGACHLIPRSTWESVGPLTEETFCGFDDLEYCMRTRAAGFVNWFYAGTQITHYCGVSVNSRWERGQVADLAINNMYMVLLGHWGVLRRKCYFAAETVGALTEVAFSGRREAGDAAVAYRREALARSRTLGLLLLSLRKPVRRCEPVDSRVGGRCPLCTGALRPSRTRPVRFAGREYRYKRCPGCRSLVCHPMPDAEVLRLMYGSEYGSVEPDHYDVDSPRDTRAVIDFLNEHPPGRILDFGCGQGDLIEAIGRETAWTPVGVELDATVAEQVRVRTGAEVMTYFDLLEGDVEPVQALHMGDVIEHLAELDGQMAALLGIVADQGHVLAEGPLQCGPTLFEASIQLAQAVRSSSPVSAPPHHVLQATAQGQRAFFSRHGLTERSFSVYEVDWPAPSRLRMSDLTHPRTVALFSLRRASRRVSSLLGWGNRYRYVGRLPLHASPDIPRASR